MTADTGSPSRSRFSLLLRAYARLMVGLRWIVVAGWIVGAGIEYALSNYWSTKLEYNYYDFGNRTTAFVTAQAPGGASAVDIAQRINAIKFGLNYNFWGLNSQTDASAAAAYAAASAQPAESTWHQTLQSEVRDFSWKSTRGFPTNLVAPPGNPQPITSPGKGL